MDKLNFKVLYKKQILIIQVLRLEQVMGVELKVLLDFSQMLIVCVYFHEQEVF